MAGPTREDSGAAPWPLLGLIVRRAGEPGQVALVLGGPARWQTRAAYTFLPLEFPGGVLPAHLTPEAFATELAARTLGQAARLLPSARVYGPSPAHAIDRLEPLPNETPRPFLRLERAQPQAVGERMRLVPQPVRAYLAALEGSASPGPETAGILWMAPDALRRVVRGLPLADVLALRGIEWRPRAGVSLPAPENALVYLPAEYGERLLLRVVAKYGPAAVF